MLYIVFNNQNSLEDLDLGILTSNEHSKTEEEIEFLEVKKRQGGSLVRRTGNYKDIILKRTFRILKTDKREMRIKRVIDWLTNIEDNRLFFSDYSERCYIVKKATIINVKDIKRHFIEIEVEFHCEPFLKDMYEIDEELINANQEIFNPGDVPTRPIFEFKLTGTAQKVTLKVNEKTLDIFNATGTLIIDSANFRAISDWIEVKTDGNFPVLETGYNNISWVGTGTAIIKKNSLYRG